MKQKSIIKSISRFHKITYLIAIAVLLTLTIVLKASYASLIVTVCGLTATVLNTKGMKYCYIFYFVQVILYGLISFGKKFYGEALLNLVYAAPMYLYAILFWKKKAQSRAVTDIYSLKINKILFLIGIVAVVTPVYGFFLSKVGTALPYVNSAATAIYIVIVYLTAGRYLEQWIVWNVYTVIQFSMWLTTFQDSFENVTIVAANIFYFIFNIVGFKTWYKLKKYLDEETDEL